MAETTYIRRYVDDFLDRAMDHMPAFMITGPRGCGKTTTALQRAAGVINLDNPVEAEAFEANPDAALTRAAKPLLIDEWQKVPDSLRALKWKVDRESGAGRFLVTGSVRARAALTPWPGTGRFIPVPMSGLTQGEIRKKPGAINFLDRVFEGDLPTGKQAGAPTVDDYLELAAAGGFPSALSLPEELRDHWHEGYLQDLLGRDVADLQEIRLPQIMDRILHAAALHTAGLPQVASIAHAVNTTQNTTGAYLDLLTELGIIERLPAWGTNRLKRMVKTPKVHLTDTGLALHLAGISPRGLRTDGPMRGRIIDSFVAAQLRPLYRLGKTTVTAWHLRDTNNRREVDLILENRQGEIAGIEVKAAGRVSVRDTRHLQWLRDEVPDQFRCGIVFHSGDFAGEIAERIWALPICAIWQD